MDDLIKLRTLASGSSGNSTFVRAGDTRLLIDAGISLRRIERALADMDESVESLSGVLVTHEHSDHIKGLKRLFSKYPETPLYSSRGTMEAASKKFARPPRWSPIRAGEPFRVGGVTVEPFELVHDAGEPTGFRLDAHGFSMGFATDLGYWTDEVAEVLAGCRVLLVEANHDPQMLQNGPYPAFLKRRIAGSRGHLSNRQARALVSRTAGPGLELVLLGHLSEKNNDAQLAIEEVGGALDPDQVRILAASKKAGPVIEFEPVESSGGRPPRQGLLF